MSLRCGTEPDDRADGSSIRRRRRSVVACRTCHRRKVRCNVATSGPPCANCEHDRIDCRVPPRTRPTNSRKVHTVLRASESHSTVGATHPTSSVSHAQSSPQPAGRTISSLSDQIWLPDTLQIVERSMASSANSVVEPQILSTTKDDSWRQATDCDEGENSAAYAAVLEDNVPGNETVPFYVGDGLAFIVDVCKPDSTTKGNHYLVPRAASKYQPSEGLARLCMQGAFSLPHEGVCKALLRCYFHYVHPFLPIVNTNDFFTKYLRGDLQKLNPLLLWSMLFAASNFADSDLCKAAGYPSRKAMKRSMYRRAKALYDADYEKDKIALIQSVILMGFWYADTEDRTGSWHWIGIAISLGQTIGLHRNPEAGHLQTQYQSGPRRPLWRRIWWSCYFREAWLSLGMARPMRINIDDCDIPMPSIDDYLGDLDGIPSTVKEQYLPGDVPTLARYWGNLMKLSAALGGVLATHYRPPSKAMPSISDIETSEKEILQCAEGCRNEGKVFSQIVELHLYQLQLYYEATVIALHRPYVLKGPRGVEPAQQESWRAMSSRKAKSAASNVNSVLNKLITTDLIHICQSITVTALIPAMQIHFLEATSSNQLAQKVAQNQINLVMIAIGELRETYWAADFLYWLFSNAQNKLESRKKAAVERESELDRARLTTPDSMVFTKEPSIQDDNIHDDLLLPDKFFSNPFLYMPDEYSMNASVDLDLDINSLFSSDLNGM